MVLRSASTNLIWNLQTYAKYLFDVVNQKCHEESLSILKEAHGRDFHWENLTVQLDPFTAFSDTTDTHKIVLVVVEF